MKEYIIISLATLIAVSMCLPFFIRLENTRPLSEAQCFLNDVYFILRNKGSYCRGYYLHCRIENGSIVFRDWVYWNGSMTLRVNISVLRVKENLEVNGFIVLKIYWKDGFLWIERD